MTHRISGRNGFILLELFGLVATRELLACVEDCARFGAYARNAAWMINLTSADEFQIGFFEMNMVARRINAQAFSSSVRCAIIVQRAPEIGVARMFRLLNENSQLEIRLVWSQDEALAWFNCAAGPDHTRADPAACVAETRFRPG